MENKNIRKMVVGMLLASLFVPLVAAADSGFYVGASAGGATVEAELGDTGIPNFPASLDDDDLAYKLFAGYLFDLPFMFAAVEGGYTDFGKPGISALGEKLTFDTSGINLWGIAGIEIGPVDLFAKLGYINWDADISGLGARANDSGNDPGFGAGLSFGIGPVSVRGEYEVYKLDDADISMLSVGLVYLFD